jgi:hypothetical protein
LKLPFLNKDNWNAQNKFQEIGESNQSQLWQLDSEKNSKNLQYWERRQDILSISPHITPV